MQEPVGRSHIWGAIPEMVSSTQNQVNSSSGGPVPIGLRIANAMHKLGVHGSPKNYEIFYDALTGINPELNSEFWALGQNISQDQLDDLRKKYYNQVDGGELSERVIEMLTQNVSETLTVLQDGQDSISAYGRVLDKTSDRVKSDTNLPPETFLRVIEVLAHATGSTLNRGRKALSSMIEKSDELKELESELKEYKRLADTDALTGVWNRRAFDQQLSKVGASGRASGSLLVVDIDKFKNINDTYGHPFGDVVIRDVAQVIRFNLRAEVFVARTGGEEFCIFIEEPGSAPAMAVANRIVLAIRQHGFSNKEITLKPGQVTASIGVCSAPPAISGEDLYLKADQALYQSKSNGRNQATLFALQQTAKPAERKNYYLYRE